MKISPPVASTLSNEMRKRIAIASLSKADSLCGLAAREWVSRKFLYLQKQKAMEALEEKFSGKEDDVLFFLPVTPAWLDQLMVALTLICHSSYGGIKELLRDVFVSVGCVPSGRKRPLTPK